jgi:hypothetical protein
VDSSQKKEVKDQILHFVLNTQKNLSSLIKNDPTQYRCITQDRYFLKGLTLLGLELRALVYKQESLMAVFLDNRVIDGYSLFKLIHCVVSHCEPLHPEASA